MINLKNNNIPVSVEPGTTILEAARQLGINIPTLCYLKDINEIGACRICTVEVKNAKGLLPACVYPVNEGMEVFTNTKKVLDARKKNLELLLSVHHKECLSCQCKPVFQDGRYRDTDTYERLHQVRRQEDPGGRASEKRHHQCYGNPYNVPGKYPVRAG